MTGGFRPISDNLLVLLLRRLILVLRLLICNLDKVLIVVRFGQLGHFRLRFVRFWVFFIVKVDCEGYSFFKTFFWWYFCNRGTHFVEVDEKSFTCLLLLLTGNSLNLLLQMRVDCFLGHKNFHLEITLLRLFLFLLKVLLKS